MGKCLRDIGRKLEEERAARPLLRVEVISVEHDPDTNTSTVRQTIKGRDVD